MYLGRHQLGHVVGLSLTTVDGSDTPTAPTRPPRVKVWNSAGTKLVNEDMPVHDRYGSAVEKTRFMLPVLLDGSFAAGPCSVTYSWQIAGTCYHGVAFFEIAPGGNGAGPVVAMTSYHRPDAEWVVYATRNGTVSRGKNPSV